MRSTYQQRALEGFKGGLDYIGKERPSSDFVRVKYECKMLEGLGHLMCEPLLFDVCEKYLDEAEALYQANKEQFGQFAFIKFNIKKNSFLKKFGFFIEALDQLEIVY